MHDDPQPPREAFARYRDQLAAVGFRPSTTRGQNFLLDPSLHRWIAEQAAPTSADTCIEVGVGLGFLTRELAARAGRLLAVEIEPRLLQIAQRELADRPQIEWLEGDALGGPGRTLLPRIGEVAATSEGRVMVVANLPYSVSGPVLAEFAQLERLPDRIVVLVQKELGQRLAAPPGAATYGGLSALLQALFDVRLLRDVPPDVFRPRPKVVSAIVQLERREQLPAALLTADARRAWSRFLRQLFGQRRKALRRTVGLAAAALGVEPPVVPAELAGMRAEQLQLPQLVELFERCVSPA